MFLQSEGKLLCFIISFILCHQFRVCPWLALQHLLSCLYWHQDSDMLSDPNLRRTSNRLMSLDNSINKQLLYNYMHPLNRCQTKRWMGWTWQNLCLSLSLSLFLSLPAGWLHKDMHSHLKMHLSTKCSLCSRLKTCAWQGYYHHHTKTKMKTHLCVFVCVKLLGSAICVDDVYLYTYI